tara:strand:- start:1200 stop:1889 length:690 start_codon:yes stop_codon:yes gene_type:complete
MKIGFTGLNIQEGKMKYEDPILSNLANKDKPKKISPFFIEFLKDEYIHSNAILIHNNSLLDLLILDIEKIEKKINRATEDIEINLLNKCLEHLEKEQPLCNLKYNDIENNMLKELSPYSFKPIIQMNEQCNLNEIIKTILTQTNNMFFYTSGSSESRSWLVPVGSDIITCAGKIHSDLAKGFIKGDVVSYEDYMQYHNFNDCKAKGVAKMVDKNYIVKANEILEIRFNV